METIRISILVGLLIVAGSCTEQDYFEIPTNADGEVVITEISEATSSGITTADSSFTVKATLPNAKEGDTMITELLKQQIHEPTGTEQLLPVDGTQKEVTVGTDLTTSVTYTRSEAQMNNAGDWVLVTFAGETASAQLRVEMVPAEP